MPLSPEIKEALTDNQKFALALEKIKKDPVSLSSKQSYALDHNGIRKLIFLTENKIAVSGIEDETVKIWDIENGEFIHDCKISKKTCPALCELESGEVITSWNTDKNELFISNYKNKKVPTRLFGVGTQEVQSLLLIPGTDWLVGGTWRSLELNVWNIRTEKRIATADTEHAKIGNNYGVNQLIFLSHENKIGENIFASACTGDKTVLIWKWEGYKEQLTCIRKIAIPTGIPVGIIELENGDLLTTSLSGIHYIWRLNNDQYNLIDSLVGGLDRIVSVAKLGPNTILSCHENNIMQVWNLKTKKYISIRTQHQDDYVHLAVAPDGKNFVTACGKKDQKVEVSLWKNQLDITSLLEPLKVNTTITVLNLNGIFLDDTAADVLIKLLEKNETLIAIDLRNTGISAEKMKVLFAHAKTCSRLTVFEFDGLSFILNSNERKQLYNRLVTNLKKLPSEIKNDLFFNIQKKIQAFEPTTSQNEPNYVSKWLKIAEEQPKATKNCIHQSILTATQTKENNIPIQHDITIICNVIKRVNEKNMKIDPKSLTEFGHFASQVLNTHANNFNAIAGSEAKVVSGFIENLKQAANSMGLLANPITDNIHQVQTHLNALAKLKIDTNFINEINVGIKTLTTDLINNVTMIVDGKLNIPKDLSDTAKALFTGKLDFKKLNQTLILSSAVLNALGCGKAGQRIMAIGQAGISIAETLMKFGSITATNGPLAPYIMIGGAIYTVFNALFGSSGPSKEELMTQQLSNQIAELGQHLEKVIQDCTQQLAKFIDQRINMLQAQIEARFDVIEKMLGQLYQTMISEFRSLKENNKKLEEAISELKKGLVFVEEKLDIYFKELTERSYLKVRSEILSKSESAMNVQEVNYYFDKISACFEFDFNSAALSGDSWSNDEKFCEEIINHGVYYRINTLFNYASKNLTNLDYKLRNPKYVVDGIYTLFKLLKTLPQGHRLDARQLKEIKKIIEYGYDIQQFVLALKTQDKFWQKLCNQYNDSFQLAWKTQAKDAFQQLNYQYQILVSFTLFAFQQEFKQNPKLYNHLQLYFLSGDDLQTILAHVKSSPFAVQFLQTHVDYTFSKLKKLILKQVAKNSEYKSAYEDNKHKEETKSHANNCISSIRSLDVALQLLETFHQTQQQLEPDIKLGSFSKLFKPMPEESEQETNPDNNQETKPKKTNQETVKKLKKDIKILLTQHKFHFAHSENIPEVTIQIVGINGDSNENKTSILKQLKILLLALKPLTNYFDQNQSTLVNVTIDDSILTIRTPTSIQAKELYERLSELKFRQQKPKL